jgi:hypothetical protein
MCRKTKVALIRGVLVPSIVVSGYCVQALGRPWSPDSSTEKFLAVAARQVSTVRMVGRFSYMGGPATTVRILAILSNPAKFDGEIMFPPHPGPGKGNGRKTPALRRFAPPQIYHVVVNGEKIWWGQPAEGPDVVPGAWYVSYFPQGRTLLPYTSESNFGVALLRRALVPVSIRKGYAGRKMIEGVTLSVHEKKENVPGEIYRVYSARYRGHVFSRIAMRLSTSQGLRIYSTSIWVMVGGHLTLASRVWARKFRRVSGVWIPMRIYQRRLAGASRSGLGPVTSLAITRIKINAPIRAGRFHFIAPDGSLVYRSASNTMNFVNYRLKSGRRSLRIGAPAQTKGSK